VDRVDVVVGVAVTGRVARLAMVGSPSSGGQVFDQYALDLPNDALTDLADTIVGTYRAVAESGNRVAATRLCLPDASAAETLRRTVLSAGVQNVEVVAEAEAAAALARSVGADAALLLADDDTVALTVVGEDEESTSVLASVPIGAAGAAVACAAVLQQVPGPEVARIMLVGQRLDLDSIAAELRSTAPVEVPPDAGYAIARGAAQTVEDSGFPAGAATQMAPAVDPTQMAPAAAEATQMAPAAGDATQMAPAAGGATVGPQLAYSQEEPGDYELPFDSLEEFVPELEDDEAYTAMIAPPPPKTVLMGSALAFVVMAFATLAVSVAINIRPAADVKAQPVPAIQSDTVPGRYLPPVPHEPDPVALPIAVVSPPPAAPAAPSVPTNRGPVTNNVPSAPPAPEAPAPGQAPAPQEPVAPIPPVIILPPLNPFPPPTFPTPTTTVTTPTTTSTTTTTTTPTTTTTTTPTTTTPTTTATTPTTIPSSPSSIATVAPEPQLPASQAPAYTPPSAPAYTPPAVAPEPALAPPPAPVIEKPAPAPMIEAPSSGGGSSSGGSGSPSGGGSSSGSGGSGQAPVTTMPVSP
jgi:uncharacterized membrane protein YgcG